MLPAPNDGCWARVLSSGSDLADVSLATRLLISRLPTKKTPFNVKFP